MKFKGNFKQYLIGLIVSYLVIGVLLAFNSSLILDISISSIILVGPFTLFTIAYGVITLNKKYIMRPLALLRQLQHKIKPKYNRQILHYHNRLQKLQNLY